jgi:hypothetical protein
VAESLTILLVGLAALALRVDDFEDSYEPHKDGERVVKNFSYHQKDTGAGYFVCVVYVGDSSYVTETANPIVETVGWKTQKSYRNFYKTLEVTVAEDGTVITQAEDRPEKFWVERQQLFRRLSETTFVWKSYFPKEKVADAMRERIRQLCESQKDVAFEVVQTIGSFEVLY